MSKYDGLGTYLSSQTVAEVPMTFAEIERVTGARLPPKAQHQRAWWSNNTSNNVMTAIWLKAGFETAQVDIAARKLIFRRRAAAGMPEAPDDFEPQVDAKPRRSPLFGALKGTFWIDPDWDLTRPVFDDEDWAALDERLDEKAATIAKSRKS